MIITKENTNNNIINPNSIVNLIGNQEQNTLENFYHKLENELGCTYMFYIYHSPLKMRNLQ